MRSVTHALSRAQRNGSEAVWMANITPGSTSKMGINFRSLLRTAKQNCVKKCSLTKNN